MGNKHLDFGFIITAVGGEGESDRQMYDGMFKDVERGIDLGFDSTWMIEHHFSDYFPTPNPLQLLSFIAGRYPEIDLGTAVLVLPWYNPLRLAEDLATFRMITDRHLHIGIGRGTAFLEYERFGMPDMDESRGRFLEMIEMVRAGLTTDKFTYDGDFYKLGLETTIRPKVEWENTTFYGAVGGSPESAEIMAKNGLPIACTAWGNIGAQKIAIDTWRKTAIDYGVDVNATKLPVMLNCIIEDTDAEAIAQAQKYIPIFMQAQLDHYDTHADRFKDLKSYQGWLPVMENWRARTQPENIPPWCDGQLVGSPETCAARIREFAEAGFGQIIVHISTPGVPTDARHRWMERFATDVRPLVDNVVIGQAA